MVVGHLKVVDIVKDRGSVVVGQVVKDNVSCLAPVV